VVEKFEIYLKLKEIVKERELLISHELRTPLTVIRGFTELILDVNGGKLDASSFDALKIILRNVEKLECSIHNLEVLFKKISVLEKEEERVKFLCSIFK